MPIICEKINEKDTPLISKSNYINTSEYVKAYPTVPSATPLGPNWSFKPCVVTSKFEKCTERIENFSVRADDVWVISYPKSGTTWTQAMVWLLANNCDYDLESQGILSQRFPYFEMETLFNDLDYKEWKSIDIIANLPSPRFIKSHLPVGLLPKQIWTIKPKIIYVSRNPKDVALSLYHHYINLQGYTHSFNDFMEVFLNDLSFFAPIHSHVLDYWHLRNESNILFLNYEDMKKDHLTIIKNTAKFLNVNYSIEELIRLKEHLTVDSMRLNNSTNHMEYMLATMFLGVKPFDPNFQFIRKGESGTFLNEMSPDLIKRFDEWTQNELKNTDFKFSM